MFKKIILIILVILIIFTLVTVLIPSLRQEVLGFLNSLFSNYTYTLRSDGTYAVSVNQAKRPTIEVANIPEKYFGREVTAIEYFDSCRILRSVTIPSSVKAIDSGAFVQCPMLECINVEPDNAVYCSKDGNLYTKDGKTFIKYASGKTDSSFTVPEGVITVSDSAFSLCTKLTSISLPDSVTEIGTFSFYGCVNLTSIDLGDELVTIGNGAFSGCRQLTEIILPGKVTSIGYDAFHSTNITSIYLGDAVVSIGDYAFGWCEQLTEITLPSSVLSIGSSAFTGCTKLAHIIYKGTVEEWNSISKGYLWDGNMESYTVTCTDGTVTK